MKPYFTDEQATLYLGDALTAARRLAELCFEHARLHPAPRTDDGSNQ